MPRLRGEGGRRGWPQSLWLQRGFWLSQPGRAVGLSVLLCRRRVRFALGLGDSVVALLCSQLSL